MNLISERLGTAVLDPATPVIAGSMDTWKLVYTVGSYGIDEGGTLKLARRDASDWGIPQFDRGSEPGFTTVTTTGEASVRAYFHRKGHIRPWTQAMVIDVYDGSLAPGDQVIIILGDRSQGSPGIRAQTFRESVHEMRFLVDPTNAAAVQRLPTSPTFPVIAGPPVALTCIVPSQARAGAPVDIFVQARDRWDNPTPLTAPITYTWLGDGEATIAQNTVKLSVPGTGWIEARTQTDDGELVCRSNPLTCTEALPRLRRYWGDLHAQTGGTVGTGTEAEYFAFGRDEARLDFTSHQGNDFQIDDEYWRHINQTVREFHEEGRFVVFPGYEWSANSPAGGDRNVFYREEGQPIFRSSHWLIPHVPDDDLSPAHPADVLFARIREHVELNNVLLASHVGGRYADIRRYFDAELGPLVEVVSCWGVFEWMLWDAFERGYVVGVMCNSDGHKGRPGAEGPGAGQFGIQGGLTCVLADTLTRDAVFSALKARRCYGTTGARIDLSFTIDEHPMGSVISGRAGQTAQAGVVGTAPMQSLSLFQGQEIIAMAQPSAFTNGQRSPRVRVSWRGARIRGRGRRVVWDGTVRVEGARIVSAQTVAFDSMNDGIRSQSDHEVRFASATTGDTDAIDLVLDTDRGGALTFESAVGHCTVNLEDLATVGSQRTFDFGGLQIQVTIERYPENVEAYAIKLAHELTPPTGQQTPYFVKAVQTDGQMAWSSPIYVT